VICKRKNSNVLSIKDGCFASANLRKKTNYTKNPFVLFQILIMTEQHKKRGC